MPSGNGRTTSSNKSTGKSKSTGPGGGMMGGRGSGGSSRTAPSKASTSKMGAKSSQTGIKSTNTKIGSAASANRAAPKKAGGSYWDKAVQTAKNLTGTTAFERQRDTIKKSFEKNAPKTAAATKKIADIATLGAEYSPVGGTAVGMFRRANQAEKTAKLLSDLKREQQALSKYVKPDKININYKKFEGPPSLAERRAWSKTTPVEKAWDTVESAIDKTTSAMGFGTGPAARAKASATVGGVTALERMAIEGGLDAYHSRNQNPANPRPSAPKSAIDTRLGTPRNFLGTGPFSRPAIPSGYSKGGAVKTRGNASKTRKKK